MFNPLSGATSQGILRGINNSYTQMNKSAERIASGKRILPTDDAAGLEIVNQLTADIRGYSRGIANGLDGMNMMATAGGAMGGINTDLQRMRELAVQAANGTLNDDNRAALQAEVSQIKDSINQASAGTEFNGVKLLDGSATSVNIQLDDGAPMDIGGSFTDASAAGLGVDGVDISTQAGAQAALDTIDAAMSQLGDAQATLGAQSNRLDGAVNNLSVRMENTMSARSRLEDVDMASELMAFKMHSLALEAGLSVQGKLLNFSRTSLSLITG